MSITLLALQTDGATPLFAACHEGHLAAVVALLNRGASIAIAKVWPVSLRPGSGVVVSCITGTKGA